MVGMQILTPHSLFCTAKGGVQVWWECDVISGLQQEGEMGEPWLEALREAAMAAACSSRKVGRDARLLPGPLRR